MKPKILSNEAVLGQQGINLIESIVLEMGCRWVSAPGLDVGIDGYIELADPATRAALGVILSVQSRATEGRWAGETASEFHYICDARELSYWLGGNAPVLLILSRPSMGEAYWVSLKDYFADTASRASRRVDFIKARDRFTPDALPHFLDKAAPRDSGLYLSPPPRPETLVSNLLTVRSHAPTIFVADTDNRNRKDAWSVLKSHGYTGGGEWFLHDQKVFSFRDLRDRPWPELVDRGTVEEFAASEWADSEDPDRIREFARLLNGALRERVYPTVRFHDDEEVFAFTSGPDMRERHIATGKGPGRLVFSAYVSKRSHHRVAYRHLAFHGQFRRFSGAWFLEILPTYRFTTDGRTVAHKNGEFISAMKRLERNQAVLGNLQTWVDFLTRPAGLFGGEYPFLSFGGLSESEIDVGISDAAWQALGEPESAREESGHDEGFWT